MHSKILPLPFQVFSAIEGVKRIVAETPQGSFGLLPNRLDCTAAIAPGILTYETENEGEIFVAVDEGVLVKTGMDVFVSVRNAIGGADLGKLHKVVQEEFLQTGEAETDLRTTLAKLESNFIRRMAQLKQE
ncbi:MAG: F0F1 ATP synthase subunit epsilon [Saprospiraceae bacterium]